MTRLTAFGRGFLDGLASLGMFICRPERPRLRHPTALAALQSDWAKILRSGSCVDTLAPSWGRDTRPKTNGAPGDGSHPH